MGHCLGRSKYNMTLVFDIVFPPLHLSTTPFFSFTVSSRIVFAKPEDLGTWQNHIRFHFLTMGSEFIIFSSGCLDLSVNHLISNMVLLFKCTITFGSISTQRPAFFSLALLSRSMIYRYTEIWK